MATTVFDTPWSTQAKAVQLKQAGVCTVIRYINHQNSTKLPEKRVTAAEAQALAAAGLDLALVFQQRQNQVADFTMEAGKKAGLRAAVYSTQVLNRPAGRPVYFSVDYDAFKDSQLAAVDTFFAGVRAGVAAAPGATAMPIGVYGSGKVCDRMRSKGLATFFWLAQSTGWSGHAAFLQSGHWNLDQGPTAKVAGIDGDPNTVNPAKPDFGGFPP